jgi:hypothetical protein
LSFTKSARRALASRRQAKSTRDRAAALAAAILLVHNYTDIRRFQAAAKARRVFCLKGRVHFITPSGDVCPNEQGQCFLFRRRRRAGALRRRVRAARRG